GAREQGMPTYWDGTRLLPYVASLLTVAVFVPIVEETTCRGVGFQLLQPYGERVAVAGTALAFALMHGAIVDFPWVLTLGLALGKPLSVDADPRVHQRRRGARGRALGRRADLTRADRAHRGEDIAAGIGAAALPARRALARDDVRAKRVVRQERVGEVRRIV